MSTPGARPDWADGAEQHLAASSLPMARLIERVGPLGLNAAQPGEPYAYLLRSIVYQQLSGKAAATIHGRVLALLGDAPEDPAALLALPDEALRGAGVSGQKVAAFRSLADNTLAGTVPTRTELDGISDDEAVARITHVRGVGRWTVEMLLLFTLGRPDVWPIDDLGVQKGYRFTFGLDALPRPKALTLLGEPFRPFRSAAAWYFWRACDLPWPDPEAPLPPGQMDAG